MFERPEFITLTRDEALDLVVALDDAITVLSDTEHLALVLTMEDQRLALFDRIWPDFPHHDDD